MPRLVDQFGRPLPTAAERRREAIVSHRRRLAARYDAAQTTDENRRHWRWADGLSADAAASPEVRAVLRRRARYEAQENNSLAKGICLTLAHDVIGTGPRLQVLLQDKPAARAIERHFARWAREVHLAERLRTAKMAKTIDGEVLLIKGTNERLRDPVKLDIWDVECDRLTSPTLLQQTAREGDGIEYDARGNPVRYHVLRQHPGDVWGAGDPLATDPYDAEHVIHLFRRDRPGQRRGISELAPALPLFGQLRRFLLATLTAAEIAADQAGVLESTADADDEDVAVAEPFDSIELDRGMFTTLPMGYKLSQLKAEHPGTTFPEFRRILINEIARCLCMPYNVAAADSSGYNYASGRLDHQTYHAAIDVERHYFERRCLDDIFFAWLDEAALVGLLPAGLPPFVDIPFRWFWPAHKHVDPGKEANAAATLWQIGLLSDDEYLFREGIDPDEHFQSLEMQQQRRRELGLPLPGGSTVEEEEEPTTKEAEAAHV